MAINLAAGSLLVALTVLIHTAGLVVLSRGTPGIARRLHLQNSDLARSLVMMLSVLGIFLLHTIEVWSWAIAYGLLRATARFADALNLSTALFSTVGYGGVTIDEHWRLLTALEGIDGFILIGWSTAYLVGVATRHGPFRKAEHF